MDPNAVCVLPRRLAKANRRTRCFWLSTAVLSTIVTITTTTDLIVVKHPHTRHAFNLHTPPTHQTHTHSQQQMSYAKHAQFLARFGKKRIRWWTLPTPVQKWTIVRGDTVQILAGTDAGRQGRVTWIDKTRNRVQVDQCKLRRRQDPKKQAYVVDEAYIHVSNVQLIDPVSKKPTRIEHRWLEDGSKARVAKRSGAVIAMPDRKPRNIVPANEEYDTSPEDVLEVSYTPPVYYVPPTPQHYQFHHIKHHLQDEAAMSRRNPEQYN
jgi:large subunit ribosomal protein L24